MIIDTHNDDKSLSINSQNTPSYQGSTMNTLSNRDKKNIRNIIKNHKIQITDSDLTSQDLKLNFNLNSQRINKTEASDISPKSPNYYFNNNNNNIINNANVDKIEDLILNNFEDTFSKNKINLKSCINLTNSNSKNHNLTKHSNKNTTDIYHNNYIYKENEIKSQNTHSIFNLNNNINHKFSENKRHHISRSIDNSLTDRANYHKYNNNNYNLNTRSPTSNSNNKTYSDINNINNSSSVIVTSDIETSLNKTNLSCNNFYNNNKNYKNSEKSIEREKTNLDFGIKKLNNNNNKSSYKNKINLKLNNKNLLKKSNNKKISINISSIQSPDHKAIYKIEKIENHENGEIKYEEFKDLNKTKTENKNTQNNFIELQNYTPANKDPHSSKLVKFYAEHEINASGKVKRLIFDDCVNNKIINKNLNNFNNNFNNNSSNNNDLNDRIQRAISNSPNRNAVSENGSSKYNESFFIAERSPNNCFNINIFNKNKTKLGISQVNKSSCENFNNINKDKNNDSYIKIAVNLTMNCDSKNPTEQNISNPNLHPKIKIIDHDNNEDAKINLINQTNSKNTFLEANDPNFNTPINRKSRPRLDSSEISASLIRQNKNNFIAATDNKKVNFVNNNYNNNPKLNFLKERYGDRKFTMLMDLLESSKDINKTLNDNEMIKSIVGEDYKIAKSFLKNISNEIFSDRAQSPTRTFN